MTADLADLFQLLDSFLVLPAHLQLQKNNTQVRMLADKLPE